MANYIIATTQEISTALNIPDLTVGDTIQTSGFYAENDGGAAVFEVKNGAGDGKFSHDIHDHGGKIAELIISNGVVNIDQLGAQPMVGAYTPFELSSKELLKAGKTPENSAETETENQRQLVKQAELTRLYAHNADIIADFTETNGTEKERANHNASIIQAVVNNTAVTELRMTAGKTYGVCSSDAAHSAIRIQGRSNFTLNGCGASIQGVFSDGTNQNKNLSVIVVNITGLPHSSAGKSNITIENLNIRGVIYPFNAERNHAGIYTENIDHLTIRNVHIENVQDGIRISDTNTDVRLNRLYIRNVFMGTMLTNVNGGYLRDSFISCEYNNLLPFLSAKKNHCIYSSGRLQNFQLNHLSLLNVGHGIAIKRDSNEAGRGISENLVFSNISVNRCRYAIALGHDTQNVIVRNVKATNILGAGLHMNCLKNITVSDSVFVGDPYIVSPDRDSTLEETTDNPDLCSTGFLIDDDHYGTDSTAFAKNITIRNCVFDFPQKFFSIDQKRGDNCEGIRVVNCLFKIHHPCLSEKKTPAYIQGIVKDIQLVCCRFEAEGFTTENHSRNGVLFFFAARLAQEERKPDGTLIHPAIPNTMHWFFDRCTFVNSGSTSVNSVFASHSGYDWYFPKVYCRVTNCILEGFRWMIRVATTKDEITDANHNLYNKPHKINPFFFIHPTDDSLIQKTDEEVVADAINALQQLNRFVSKNNLYHHILTSGGSEYTVAEEYGI